MGSLEERNISLWVATSEESQYEPLTGEPSFDAVVLGAGITGLTTALLLQREGMRVAVVEADRVASGVTGYTTAKVTALHDSIFDELLSAHGAERVGAYAAANMDAVERVGTIVEEERIDCELQRLDTYTFAETQEGVETIQREAAACTEAGLPVELTNDAPLPFPISKAILLRDQIAIHPRRYCLGLARAVDAGGGRVYERTRAIDVKEVGDVCRVETERGSISARYVVVATHLPFMGDGRFYAKTSPSRSYAIAFPDAGHVTDGMLINIEEPVRSLRPASADGNWLIVGGEGHKVGHDEQTEERYEALEDWAQQRLGLTDPGFRWSAQDYITLDGMPYVGRLSTGHERTYVATGFRKWGMSNGTAAARLIVDAIAGRDNPWAFAFDSTRTRPLQSAKRFVVAGLDTAKHLVLDKIGGGDGSPEELAAGEGAVVKIDGENVAVYRDEDGRLHALSADCTHMGCLVAWNSAERSWDCPCHGSRFAADGSVLQGPANEPLEPKTIPERSRR